MALLETVARRRIVHSYNLGSALMTKRLWSAVFALMLLAAPAAQQPPFDILITNARVLDGSGNPWIRADIGIRGDRIVAMGKLAGGAATTLIDAKDRYVTPGFMDVHSHAAEPWRARNCVKRARFWRRV